MTSPAEAICSLAVEERQGERVWRAHISLSGQDYHRTLGPVSELSEAQAQRQLERLLQAVTPESDPDDVLYSELSEEYWAHAVPRYRASWLKHTEARCVLPWLGDRIVRSITAADLLPHLRYLQQTQAPSVAPAARQVIGQVISYGTATGRASHNPALDLKGIIPRPQGKHMATLLDPVEISKLQRAVNGLRGRMRHRILLQAYTFTRSGECATATWDEIDWRAKVWRIDAVRTKMRRPHLVPLATQVLELLRDLKRLTKRSLYLFPSPYTDARPVYRTSPWYALRYILGYDNTQFTLHGYRAMASSILNEAGWPVDAIERQLAHVERNKVRAAYNRAEYLDTRVSMLQWWADYLDALRDGTEPPAKR